MGNRKQKTVILIQGVAKMKIIFWLSLLMIGWGFVGYPLVLILVNFVSRTAEANASHSKPAFDNDLPFVSFIVAAHNEEKIISKKIENINSLNYPKEKLEIIIASDHSTDNTNEIVNEYAKMFPNLKLLVVEKRGGKVNAQNEAVKIAKGAVLAFSDANTMWERDALKNLLQYLLQDNVSYVCGHLIYTNQNEGNTAYSEGLYWKMENFLKELESKFCSITAGNGGIYVVRREDYPFVNPLYSHDLVLPLHLATKGKKAIFSPRAFAFEKAGFTLSDEWQRKVRMFGRTMHFFFHNISFFINPFRTNFKYFLLLFSHRTLRYTLPLWHILLFLSSLFLGLTVPGINIYSFVLYAHFLFILLALIGAFTKTKIKVFYMPFYYSFFLLSMVKGFLNMISGRIKPYWEPINSIRNM